MSLHSTAQRQGRRRKHKRKPEDTEVDEKKTEDSVRGVEEMQSR